MTNSVKIILISLGCIGAGIGVYYLFFRNRNEEQFPEVKDESKEEKEIFEEEHKDEYITEGTILEMFSRGNNVKCLQSVLNVRGCKDKNGSGLTVDGKFGPLTESALEGCGDGKTISINRLKKMMQTELDKGLSIDCSDSSCCASLVAKKQESTTPSYSYQPNTIHSKVPLATEGSGGGYSGQMYAITPDDMYFSGENEGFNQITNSERLWNEV